MNARGMPLWRKLIRRIALVALVMAAVALLSVGFGQMAGGRKGTLDFANFYPAGRIVVQGQPERLYDFPLQEKIESQASPGGPFQPYDHPPFEALLFAPFSLLPYHRALQLWSGMNLLLMILVFYLLGFTGYRLDTAGYLVWLAVCMPLVIGALLLGQDTLLLAPIFLLAFLALKKRRGFVAGLILGLGLFRFEILLPFVFVFLLRRRWKLLAGFSTAGVAALAVSLGLVGWGGLADYGRVLLATGQTTGSQANGVVTATMPSLRGAVATLVGKILPSAALFPLILAGTLALLGWAAWQFKDIADPASPGYDLEFSMATLAALLASYHLFVHEMTPLIVVGFLMLGYEETARKTGTLRDRACAALLLLFALVFFGGGAGFGFQDFSVLFIVFFGLMIWLSQEISAIRSRNAVTSDLLGSEP